MSSLSDLSWQTKNKKESDISKIAKNFGNTLHTKPGTVINVDILGLSANYFKKYSSKVIKDRALPDYRDGLKPVHRRILWAAYAENYAHNKPYVKSARWHGVTMGVYHPHGDASIHSSMQTMVNSPYQLVDGYGSWGWFAGEDAAAARYVEARLAKFAQVAFLNPEYIAVTPMVSNYDGTTKEPLYLPCLVPYVLLAGMQGIAVGTTCGLPPFKLAGVMKLVEMQLEGKEIKRKHMLKHLKLNYKWGGTNATPKQEFKDYLKTGKGRLIVQHDYKVDVAKKQITIIGVGPNYNDERFTNKAYEIPEVASVSDQSSSKNGIKIVITLRKTVPTKNVQTIANTLVSKCFNTSINMATNITARFLEVDALGDVVEDARFIETNVKEIIQQWCLWRVELEKAMLANRIAKLKEALARTQLYKLAVEKIDVVFKVLKAKHKSKDDMAVDLSRKLKLVKEDAHVILELQAYRLSNMSGAELDRKIKELKQSIKDNDKLLKSPRKAVLNSIPTLIKDIA